MTSDVIEQVALVIGRIVHEGTGAPVIGSVRITAQEGPLVDRLLEDGTFALSARPEVLFPDLATQNYQLTLTIRAVSPQYAAGEVEQGLTVAIPAGTTFDPPIDVNTLRLPADPVNLRGRVVEATNPETPIVGATLEILQGATVTGSATTDASGRYRMDGITVLASATLRCSAAGFQTQARVLLIDFTRPVNEAYFRLSPP